MRIQFSSIFYLFLFICFSMTFGCEQATESNDTPPVENVDIEELLSQMTLEEKVNMIHASSSFTSGGCERLGIPEMTMSDGPHGVRHEHGRDWAKDEGGQDSCT